SKFFSVVMSFFWSFFFSSRRRHTRSKRDWSSDVCSSDLYVCYYSVENYNLTTQFPSSLPLLRRHWLLHPVLTSFYKTPINTLLHIRILSSQARRHRKHPDVSWLNQL